MSVIQEEYLEGNNKQKNKNCLNSNNYRPIARKHKIAKERNRKRYERLLKEKKSID